MPRRPSRRPSEPSIPGTEYVDEGAPLESRRPGAGPARAGAVLTALGVVFSVFASLLSAVVLVRVQLDSPYATVQEALDAGEGGDYLVPLVAMCTQVLWVLLVLVGFFLLLAALVRGYRRAWVWTTAVCGPVGLLLSFGVFVGTMAVTVSA